VQEPAKAGFGTLPGGKGAAVESFPSREVPFAANAKEPATPEGDRPCFSRPALGVHNRSCGQCLRICTGRHVSVADLFKINPIRRKFNLFLLLTRSEAVGFSAVVVFSMTGVAKPGLP
jgi:hypothetical protein